MPEALARTGICEETIRCGLTDEAAASNQTQEVNIVYRKVDTNLNFVVHARKYASSPTTLKRTIAERSLTVL